MTHPPFRSLSLGPLLPLVTLALVGLLGCGGDPAHAAEDDEHQGEAGHVNAAIDGPTCFNEEPGCGCEPGTPPATCTTSEERGELVLCEAGAMYCVEGRWSACETVHTWELPRPKVIQRPGACSLCDPDCFQSDDEPDQGDIDDPPEGVIIDDVEFDSGPPRGIRPVGTTTNTMGGVDTDMDGVPDAADDCPNVVGTAGFFGCPTSASAGGFFHVLPPGTSAVDPLTFDVQLTEADIYLLVDTTGSMGDEIANLRAGLTTGVLDTDCPTLRGVIGAIRCTIPGTWFGVGRFEDYPVGDYGRASYGDRPFVHMLDVTESTTAAQTSVNSLAVRSGHDIPESNSQALYAIATGEGLSLYGTEYTAPRTGCAAGRWGYPCFRPNVIPIVIMITDARMHNGPNGNEYAGTLAAPVPSGSLDDTDVTTHIGSVNGAYRVFTGSTASALDDKDGGGCYAESSNDRQIVFTVATTTRVVIDLSGSAFDTVAFLYDGNTTDDAELVTCNDDGGSGYTSRIVRTLTPGTYALRIDGYNGSQGEFQLGIGEEVTIPGGVPYADVVAAMNARNMRVIGVNSGPSSAYDDLRDLASDTDSLDGAGNPFIEDIDSDGTGLSTAVVDAVVDLANFSRMDVDVVVEDVELLAGVPASALVDDIALSAPGCSAGCAGTLTNGCSSCLPGTSLPFSVTFRNEVITPTTVDQVFDFDLIVRANQGEFELQRVPVRILVPANAPATTYTTGTFSRTFDASETCAIPPTRPDWGLFTWEIARPGNSAVVFQFRTAETEAELDTTAPVTIAVPAGQDAPGVEDAIDVGERLRLAGGENFLPFLRVTTRLTPSSDGTQAPVLTSMSLQYGCVDSE